MLQETTKKRKLLWPQDVGKVTKRWHWKLLPQMSYKHRLTKYGHVYVLNIIYGASPVRVPVNELLL